MSFFLCLARTKVSVQVRSLLYECFVTRYSFTAWSCYHLAQPPSRRTTPCWLSAIVYSV
jgi:hypothetical protein